MHLLHTGRGLSAECTTSAPISFFISKEQRGEAMRRVTLRLSSQPSNRLTLRSSSSVGASNAVPAVGDAWAPTNPLSSSNRQWLLLGAMFLVGGAVLDVFSSRKELIVTKLLEYFVTTIQVRSNQEAFPIIMDFVASLPGAEDSIRNFMVSGGEGGGGSAGDNGARDNIIALKPGLGAYMMDYKGTRVTLSRAVDTDRAKSVNLSNDLPQVTTVTLWTTDRRIVNQFLADAQELHRSKRGSETKIYIPDASGYGWQYLGSRLKRDPSTLFFPPHIQEGVSKEIATYLKHEGVYRQLGVPWRRGYLFHGPPGTGKSSFISALAAEHDLPVYLLQNLGQSPTDGSGGGGIGLPRDDQLLSLLNSCVRPSIVVLEDLDTSAVAESDVAPATPRVSGLLNALDGIASTDGRIVIATANRVELIPAALRRPGRIDREIFFDHIQENQQMAMRQWYSDTLSDGQLSLPTEWRAATPATLQHNLLTEMLFKNKGEVA